MAEINIAIPAGGDPGDTHVKKGDRVSWQSTAACTVSFNKTPFSDKGGPQSIAVPRGGSRSTPCVVAGPSGPYPYSIAFGAAASDPGLIVDP